MTANTVYDVFKALPHEEQLRLIALVNEHKLSIEIPKKKKEKKPPIISKEAAIDYLMKNIFSKK
ncbi:MULTISPECIES: hypothetical protein [Flavobacterium]|uniref:hypothetical protein n=1 Tax=Flavobacterium TaxID=237 RepID=UPI001FCBD10D|nr:MULTISPECIES: hypothetical protein [Flavobacterium]UOK42526.1 hypothetical protein LZF87_14615 [Flavobacterium enshiense]